jgi:hypothetical protein
VQCALLDILLLLSCCCCCCCCVNNLYVLCGIFEFLSEILHYTGCIFYHMLCHILLIHVSCGDGAIKLCEGILYNFVSLTDLDVHLLQISIMLYIRINNSLVVFYYIHTNSIKSYFQVFYSSSDVHNFLELMKVWF